jgi:signal transduction histidine kinase
MKNFEKARANHIIALDIRRSLRDEAGKAESFNNIGALYYYEGNLDRAIANLELGLESARESQSHTQIMKSAEFLSFCYRDMQQFQKALEYKDLFIGMNDLLQNERNEQRLLDVQNRYEINKKETQIAKLEKVRLQREQQLREEARFRNFLFAILGLVVVIVVLVLYMYLSKRRSNKILEAANHTVQQQNISLQELNATKDKFFSIISHDLKGPLNSLTSFSGLLINHADSLSKEEITMLAKDLDKSLKNLFALLENLLEWSRSQTGNIEFTPEVFDLQKLLDINRELLSAQAQTKNIEIVHEPGAPIHVLAHKHSVNTVIRNLISNAIKFTGTGGKIIVGIKHVNKELIISIADTGVGMPKEIVDKLFRIDTKHSTRGTADEKGTGLGLILCKEFIEKNGGRIWVESAVGKGSSFYFTLTESLQVNSPVVA